MTRIPAMAPLLLALAATSAACPAQTAQITAEMGQAEPPYAVLADQLLAAPLVADVTIRSASRLKDAEAAGVAMGQARFYVIADVAAVIRGPAGLPPRISYLADVPLDARGKPPKLKKARMLIFAQPVPGRAGEVQLVGAAAQRPWSAPLDARVRGIAGELVARNAPPTITGVGNSFHVAGSLPGEGETQIFLTTADSRPVSLSILRRPGEATRWAVALGEIVDEAAAPPPRDTLLWYRLACGLPRTLPDRALAAVEPADAAIAREDYQFVLRALGPCRRG